MDESALSIFSESEEDHMLEIKLRILHGTHKDPLTLQDNLWHCTQDLIVYKKAWSLSGF